jgi:hypothetical protein
MPLAGFSLFDPRTVQPVASHYTEYALQTPNLII